MASVKVIVDELCANFTEDAVYRLVKTFVAEKPCTMEQLCGRIMEKDKTLDIASAKRIADAAVETLWQIDDIVVDGDLLCAGAGGHR